jgi:hypothetical protein
VYDTQPISDFYCGQAVEQELVEHGIEDLPDEINPSP